MKEEIVSDIKYEHYCDFSLFSSYQIKKYREDIFKHDCTIYTPTNYASLLFESLKDSPRKHVVISSTSDAIVDKKIVDQKPDTVKKWFTQNVDFQHSDVIPLPIGLRTFKKHYIEWLDENLDYLRTREKDINVLYCNWNTYTNYGVRAFVKPKLKNANIQFIWDRDLTKQYMSTENIPFQDYCDHLSAYKFIVSPPGAGPDCYRTWEAIYMGSIPIVLKHPMYDTFGNLPIIQVNDYDEITYELLHSYLNKEYDYTPLKLSYWINKFKTALYE